MIYYLFALAILFHLPAPLLPANNVVEDMKVQLVSLGEGKSFVHAEIGLNNDEMAFLDRLKVQEAKRHDQFGNLSLLPGELRAFLKDIGNDDEDLIETTIQLICRTVQSVIDASNKTSAWVSIRSHLPSIAYDSPRWHMDGSDYGLNTIALYPRTMWKFVTTLKGPSTLMYDLPFDLRETFMAHFNDREFLNRLLDVNLAEKSHVGQGIFFIVGDKNQGAIHSEPSVRESRLFLSVVAGSEAEIQELYERRSIQSPGETLWEEEYIYREWGERDERERNKPQIGQEIISPTDSYKVISQINSTLYAAKSSSGKMFALRWGAGHEYEFMLGQLFDYPTIIKSREIFPLKDSTGSFNVLEFVQGKNLLSAKLNDQEAITVAKQLIGTIRYIYSLNYFFPNLDMDQLMLDEEKKLKFVNLYGFSDLEEVLDLYCCEYCDCEFNSIDEFINIYYFNKIAKACVQILSKGSSNEKIINRARLMTYVWTCQADFENGRITPLEDYLDQLDEMLDSFRLRPR